MLKVFMKARPIMMLSAALLLALPASAAAQTQKLDIRPYAKRVTGKALRESFSGKTHDGAYNFNAEGQSRYSYLETHAPNGDVVYNENGRPEAGLWDIYDETLCYAYVSKAMNGGCFRVYRIANCFYFYASTLPEREDEAGRDYWTARSVIDGETPECEAVFS